MSLVIIENPDGEDTENFLPTQEIIENLQALAQSRYPLSPILSHAFTTGFMAGMLLGSQRPEAIMHFFEELATEDSTKKLLKLQDLTYLVYPDII